MYMIFHLLVIKKIFQVSIIAMAVTMDSAMAVSDVLPPFVSFIVENAAF